MGKNTAKAAAAEPVEATDLDALLGEPAEPADPIVAPVADEAAAEPDYLIAMVNSDPVVYLGKNVQGWQWGYPNDKSAAYQPADKAEAERIVSQIRDTVIVEA